MMNNIENKVLVVAPHPDDETLGCGGSLIKHAINGEKIFWMIVTNIQNENGWSAEVVQKRQREIHKVSEMYGFEKTFKFDFPTTMLDTIPYSDLVSKMYLVIQEVKPTIIYIPNRNDIHTDHQITFNAAISCCKNFRAPSVQRIMMYECLSETEFAPALQSAAFMPNVYIDVTDFLDKKIEIMKLYGTEIMAEPLPRSISSIRALGRYRGSRIGVQYAEAFMLLFEKK